MHWMEMVILDNTLTRWAIAASIFLAFIGFLLLLKRIVLVKLITLAKRTQSFWDDALLLALAKTRLGLLLPLSLYLAAHSLTLPVKGHSVLRGLAVVTLLLQVGLWGNQLIALWLANREKSRDNQDAANQSVMIGLVFLFRMIVWALVVLLILDNLGVNITTLAASLGIGGIAVALAAQNILGDLFASLSIVFDKPFLVGDFIVVDDKMGSVERIGIKTTRLRALGGEQIIFSNADLLRSRIHNQKRLNERRVQFEIGVTYETPRPKIQEIPTILREAISRQAELRFDRAHLIKLGDSALVYQAVFYVLCADFNLYLDAQQAVYLEIFARFEQEGIAFAYPTQTLLLKQPSQGSCQVT